MPETSGARSHRHRLAAPLHHHAAQPQVEPVELSRLRAQGKQSRRSIVGNGVEKLDVPLLDAAADDLHRGQNVSNRGNEIGERDASVLEIAIEHQCDFGLDLWLQHAVERHFLAIVDCHVCEKHPEVR